MVLDLKMPEMDGWEVLKRVSADYPDLPVLILTGIETKKEDYAKGIQRSATDYAVKPIKDQEELEITIEKAIAIKKQAIELAQSKAAEAEARAQVAEAKAEALEFISAVSQRTAELVNPRLANVSDAMRIAVSSGEQERNVAELEEAQKDLKEVARLIERLARYDEIPKQTPKVFLGDRLKFAKGIIDNYQDVEIGKEHRVTVKLPSPEEMKDLYVKGNTFWLSESLVILLENAVKACRDEEDNALVQLQVRRDDNGQWLYVDVMDNGPGMKQELVETFFNTDKSKRRLGSGLGLFFVRKMLDALGGDMEYERRDEKTRITLKLPSQEKRVQS